MLIDFLLSERGQALVRKHGYLSLDQLKASRDAPAPRTSSIAIERRRASPERIKLASFVFTGLAVVARGGDGRAVRVAERADLGACGAGFITGQRWYYRHELVRHAPMLYGTPVVAAVAMLLAAPLGIGAAVFSAEFLPRRLRLAVKLTVELLAGVPRSCTACSASCSCGTTFTQTARPASTRSAATRC